MIRRILVPLDLSPYSQEATEHACELAKVHRAQVTGMTVLDTPEIAAADVPFHAALVLDTAKRVAEKEADARSRMADGLARFVKTCEERGVAHSESEFQGVPANCILKLASYYDLVVMGLRTFFHFETRTEAGNSLEKVLDHTPAPVLAVPKHDERAIGKVLVAFNGSPHAIRALRSLAAFEPAGRMDVTVLMSGSDPEEADFHLNQAAAFLRCHRFENVETVATTADIGTLIDEDYIDQVDLVVAGVHSKHAIKDFFVGSLTRQLIDYGHTALLLGQ